MMCKKGILLVNLGTPDSPSTGDVAKYLNEFLMDERVITIHPFLRALLVKGIIVPFRSRRSAKLYSEIWNLETGSPLMHYSSLQQQILQSVLGNRYQVELAMRYQNPSIETALSKLKQAESIKVIPLFPQYASATSGSVIEQVMRVVSKWSTIPPIEFVNSFHDHPKLITAFASRAKRYSFERFDYVIFSFHGLPLAHLTACDTTKKHCLKSAGCCNTMNGANKYCYGAQCHHTARLIAAQLPVFDMDYTVCFQSRLGNTPWMQPYTADVITKLAQEGKKRILVFCPAFVADCLETIYEIGVEYRELFIKAGGEHLQLVEGLNHSPLFIEMLEELVLNDAVTQPY